MEVIYDKHEEEWQKCLTDKERIRVAATWMKQGTLDRWRHERMLESIRPLLTPGSTWLTVGDGRYGTDANYIIRHGGVAHASDISDTLLKIGSDAGFIGDYSAQNAEKLNFGDEQFDYVLIKEAFHHLPRPWVALYEAFRVCRKGVVLIEPNDDESPWHLSLPGATKNLIRTIKRSIKALAFPKLPRPERSPNYQFETVGNFIYAINRKELEKFLLGMHYQHIATRGVNDAYEEGVEFIMLNSDSTDDQATIQRLKEKIASADRRCSQGLQNYSILIATLFKDPPAEGTQQRMKAMGWNIKELPKNPYI